VQVLPPKVLSATFVYDAKPQSIRYTFSSDVSASLALSDLTATNATTSTNYAPASLTYDALTRTATFTFAGTLPTGAYQATLWSDRVYDLAGYALDGDANALPGGDHTLAFIFLPGDANHDNRVDFTDLVALSQNYNTAARTYAKGDFNFDGLIDFNDLVILSQNYNASMTLPASSLLEESTQPAAVFAIQPTTAKTQPSPRRVTPAPKPHATTPFLHR
jgi:hypothetical protein